MAQADFVFSARRLRCNEVLISLFCSKVTKLNFNSYYIHYYVLRASMLCIFTYFPCYSPFGVLSISCIFKHLYQTGLHVWSI